MLVADEALAGSVGPDSAREARAVTGYADFGAIAVPSAGPRRDVRRPAGRFPAG